MEKEKDNLTDEEREKQERIQNAKNTKYETIKFDGKNSLVKIRLITGRTHQIRASFAHIKHPLVGDSLYGNECQNKNMYLKANYLKFRHPITLKKITITID